MRKKNRFVLLVDIGLSRESLPNKSGAVLEVINPPFKGRLKEISFVSFHKIGSKGCNFIAFYLKNI